MEIKDLLGTLGIEDVNDIEEFKTKFKTKFVSKSDALNDDEVKSKITGRVAGAITTLAKREFGLSADEIDGMKYEDIIKLGASRFKEKITDLEKLTSGSSDSNIKELTEKLEKTKQKAEEYKSLADNLKNAYESEKSNFEGKIKEFKTNIVLSEAKSKIATKLRSDMTEAERFFFEHKVKENLQIDFEDDAPIVLSKDGKRIENKNKLGSFLTIEEALENTAEELGLIKKNNGGVIPMGQTTQIKQQTQVPTTGAKIHPNALKQLNK